VHLEVTLRVLFLSLEIFPYALLGKEFLKVEIEKDQQENMIDLYLYQFIFSGNKLRLFLLFARSVRLQPHQISETKLHQERL
jgi:hypothetical protein